LSDIGERKLIYSTLLAAASSAAIPITLSWNPKVAAVMVAANVLAVLFGRLTIQKRNVGPSLPILSDIVGSIPTLIAATSFGHILGAGAILGLSSIGAL
jgi:photosystem I subunit X